MKVICAGMPKTGTKSLSTALRILGYNVYDYMENFEFLEQNWMEILQRGGTIAEFRDMYKNVDGVCDAPSCIFWEEISQAFPDAKIILSIRENEDIWIKSSYKQSASFDTPLIKLMLLLSPSCRSLLKYSNALFMACYGFVPITPVIRKRQLNENLPRKGYRKHNTYVLQAAPQDRLLQYNVREGWAPLCKFLGVEIPRVPFPHENQSGGITAKFLSQNRVLIRMQREMKAVVAIFVGILAYIVYYLIFNV